MTTIYVPRLIESAEQAEALPEGTVAHRAVIGGPARYAATRTPSNDWYIGGREFQDHDFMIGWTALVPIEAEEDIILVYSDEPDKMWANETYYSVREAQSIADGRPDYLPAVEVRTRYVTPWEAV